MSNVLSTVAWLSHNFRSYSSDERDALVTAVKERPSDAKLRTSLAEAMVPLVTRFVVRKYRNLPAHIIEDLLVSAVSYSWKLAMEYRPELGRPSTFWHAALRRMLFVEQNRTHFVGYRKTDQAVVVAARLQEVDSKWWRSDAAAVKALKAATMRHATRTHIASEEFVKRLRWTKCSPATSHSVDVLTSESHENDVDKSDYMRRMFVCMLLSIDKYAANGREAEVLRDFFLSCLQGKSLQDIMRARGLKRSQPAKNKFRKAVRLAVRGMVEDYDNLVEQLLPRRSSRQTRRQLEQRVFGILNRSSSCVVAVMDDAWRKSIEVAYNEAKGRGYG